MTDSGTTGNFQPNEKEENAKGAVPASLGMSKPPSRASRRRLGAFEILRANLLDNELPEIAGELERHRALIRALGMPTLAAEVTFSSIEGNYLPGEFREIDFVQVGTQDFEMSAKQFGANPKIFCVKNQISFFCCWNNCPLPVAIFGQQASVPGGKLH